MTALNLLCFAPALSDGTHQRDADVVVLAVGRWTAGSNVADVQLAINQALSLAPAGVDLTGGTINVTDVQIEINAALGFGLFGKVIATARLRVLCGR